jgi:hypothetical protein
VRSCCDRLVLRVLGAAYAPASTCDERGDAPHVFGVGA